MVRYLRGISVTVLIAGNGLLGAQAQQANQNASPRNKILAHALAVETGREAARPHEARVSSGVMYPLWVASGAIANRARASVEAAGSASSGSGGMTPPTGG